MTTLTEEPKIPETKANTRKSRAKKTGYGLLISANFLLPACKGKDKSPELQRATTHEKTSEQYEESIKEKEKNAKKLLDLREELKEAKDDSVKIAFKADSLKKELKKDTL